MIKLPVELPQFLTMFYFLFVLWTLYVIPILLFCVPLWFLGRKRVKWTRWDFALLVFPYWLWAILLSIDDYGNTPGEVMILALCSIIAVFLRLIVGKHVKEKYVAVILLGCVSLVAVVLWKFPPPLSI